MKNEIVIGLDDLSKQQDAITDSNLETDIKEGLGNLFSTILDMAEGYSQEKEVTMVMVIE